MPLVHSKENRARVATRRRKRCMCVCKALLPPALLQRRWNFVLKFLQSREGTCAKLQGHLRGAENKGLSIVRQGVDRHRAVCPRRAHKGTKASKRSRPRRLSRCLVVYQGSLRLREVHNREGGRQASALEESFCLTLVKAVECLASQR